MMEGLNVEEMDVQNNDEVEEFLDGMINMSIPEDSEEEEEVKDVWEASEYADETGPVTWGHVVTEVSKVLESHVG